MTNIESWDRVAARRGEAGGIGVVQYGADLPTEADLRLCGDLSGKRVLDIGCGSGENAVTMAVQGAHVIAIDVSRAQIALGKRLAESAEIRVEWHESDAADLAFLRADSIDLALSTGVVDEIEDFDRLLRQVHRVLRPGSAFVFAHQHPMRLAVGRDEAPGALPFGALEVRRSYFDPSPMEVRFEDEPMQLWPRTIADVFSALHRAGYRVDALLEPEPVHTSDPGPLPPKSIIWRARKEGL